MLKVQLDLFNVKPCLQDEENEQDWDDKVDIRAAASPTELGVGAPDSDHYRGQRQEAGGDNLFQALGVGSSLI